MEDCDIPDELSFSQLKLSNLLAQENDEKLAVYKFIEDCKYPNVPEFQPDLEWFNVSEPLSIQDHLKGKVVLLDFFTYCCINCMHILPQLKELEDEYSVENGLVVVGVHSAKFANEKLSTNILSAVQRYNITHPVVNDRNCDLWKNCEIQCWPTLLILGPFGNPLLMLIGEGHKDKLRTFIHHTINYYKSKNHISNHSIPHKSAYHLLPDLKGPLLFPGKITSFVNEKNNLLLAISDTGNHRILVTNEAGVILHEIGSQKCGYKDGNFKNSQFNNPQGLVFYNENVIYVADTENHAVRMIDLKNNVVSSIIGTGEQGNDYEGGNMGSFQEISSPWDLVLYKTSDDKEVLFIAMAGTHQIWAYFLDDVIWWKNKKYAKGTCASIVGSGKEENKNNRYPHAAAFAQPSGLSISYKTNELFVADSESSCVRKVNLTDGAVSAVVGGDKNPTNLFAYGDKDGTLQNAKLQHVLGVAMANDDSTLFVADSYNHKIKKIDIEKSSISTMTAVKNSDALDGKETAFNEPGGICRGLHNNIYVADTNNHSIKVLEYHNKDYSVLSVKNLELKVQEKQETKNYMAKILSKAINLNPHGGKVILKVKLTFSDGLKLSPDAPQHFTVDLPNALWSAVPKMGTNVENFEVIVSVPSGTSESTINIAFSIVTCTASACIPKKFACMLPVKFEKAGGTKSEQSVNIKVGPNELKL